jgi:hypothetical protein
VTLPAECTSSRSRSQAGTSATRRTHYAGNPANLERVSQDPNYRSVEGDTCDLHTVEPGLSGYGGVVYLAAGILRLSQICISIKSVQQSW